MSLTTVGSRVLRKFTNQTRPSRRLQHLFDLLISVENAGLPRIPIQELQDRLVSLGHGLPDRLSLHSGFTGIGSGSVAEMAILSALVAQVRPKKLLEFGTCDGASTWHLHANAPKGAALTTIDLPSGEKVAGSSDVGLQGISSRRFLPRSSDVRLVEIDSREWKPDLTEIDFAFIDAGHSYNCVKNDTEKTFQVMRKGGLVVWHDASWRRDGYGVNQYLSELRAAEKEIMLVASGPYDYCALAVLIV